MRRVRGRIPVRGRFISCPGVAELDSDPPQIGASRPRVHLPSPSRHIYNSLTTAVAFAGLSAFDRVWQHPIKVDGTFA